MSLPGGVISAAQSPSSASRARRPALTRSGCMVFEESHEHHCSSFARWPTPRTIRPDDLDRSCRRRAAESRFRSFRSHASRRWPRAGMSAMVRSIAARDTGNCLRIMRRTNSTCSVAEIRSEDDNHAVVRPCCDRFAAQITIGVRQLVDVSLQSLRRPACASAPASTRRRNHAATSAASSSASRRRSTFDILLEATPAGRRQTRMPLSNPMRLRGILNVAMPASGARRTDRRPGSASRR